MKAAVLSTAAAAFLGGYAHQGCAATQAGCPRLRAVLQPWVMKVTPAKLARLILSATPLAVTACLQPMAE
ncbi:hypothetical protein, partial [Erythrobacter donghaensis]|uniref:hypothetical protein n=1 Tax=Erythrobacter donghaensis TaxID=267135 RepID=UPI001E3BBAAB